MRWCWRVLKSAGKNHLYPLTLEIYHIFLFHFHNFGVGKPFICYGLCTIGIWYIHYTRYIHINLPGNWKTGRLTATCTYPMLKSEYAMCSVHCAPHDCFAFRFKIFLFVAGCSIYMHWINNNNKKSEYRSQVTEMKYAYAPLE